MGRGHLRALERFVYEARESWEWRAACIGRADTFFPKRGQAKRAREAKEICLNECDVFDQCQAKVQANPPEYGVWAGKLYQPPR